MTDNTDVLGTLERWRSVAFLVPGVAFVLITINAGSLFSRLAEPGALVPLAGQKRICTKTALPSARGYRNLRNWA
jgi:hypothetical protein